MVLTDGEGAPFCLSPLASGEGLQSMLWGDSVRTKMVLFPKTKAFPRARGRVET